MAFTNNLVVTLYEESASIKLLDADYRLSGVSVRRIELEIQECFLFFLYDEMNDRWTEDLIQEICTTDHPDTILSHTPLQNYYARFTPIAWWPSLDEAVCHHSKYSSIQQPHPSFTEMWQTKKVEKTSEDSTFDKHNTFIHFGSFVQDTFVIKFSGCPAKYCELLCA